MSKTYVYHPCLDVSDSGELELKIFNCMFNEWSLPKFEKVVKKLNEKSEYAIKDYESMNDAMVLSYISAGSDDHETKRRYGRYLSGVSDFFNKKRTLTEKITGIFHKSQTPEETFNMAKACQELIDPKIEKETMEKFDKLTKRAIDTNQIALLEILEKYKKIFLMELSLAKNGFDTYITEKQAIIFMKNSSKGVRLDFLRGYTRSIPINVANLKAKADDLRIFDNYCVMHYDPSLKVLKEQSTTKNVKEAKQVYKDPILFGMINGSRKLYYIADWITDDDDLTLDKLMSELEGPAQRERKLSEMMQDSLDNLEIMIQDFDPIL